MIFLKSTYLRLISLILLFMNLNKINVVYYNLLFSKGENMFFTFIVHLQEYTKLFDLLPSGINS